MEAALVERNVPDSDVDVALLLHGERQRFLHTKLQMADLAFDVLLETGVLMSPLPVWLDEWEHPENHSNPYLLHTIRQEGIRLRKADNWRPSHPGFRHD